MKTIYLCQPQYYTEYKPSWNQKEKRYEYFKKKKKESHF